MAWQLKCNIFGRDGETPSLDDISAHVEPRIKSQISEIGSKLEKKTEELIAEAIAAIPSPKDGKSAHELWLDEGHTGDFDAFINYLAQKAGVFTGSIFTNTNTGGGAVSSVNGQTGAVVLDIDDIGGVYADGVTITGDGTSGNPLVAIGDGTGDVHGPASSTDNAIARYDLTTGKIIQNSGATIDDSGKPNAFAV